MNNKSLKFKLLVFIAFIVILMTSLNLYSIYKTKSFEAKYSDMIGRLMTIDGINQDMNLSVLYFDKYFTTSEPSDWQDCNKYSKSAMDKVQSLQGVLDKDSSVTLMDIKGVIESYQASANKAFQRYVSGNKSSDFYPDFEETKTIAGFCDQYVKVFQQNYLKYNNQQYQVLMSETGRSSNVIITLLFFIIIWCMAFAIVFSDTITIPLKKLVLYSQKVSKGKFETVKVDSSKIYEIDVLAEGFNKMITAIEKLIEKMKEKANVEKQLKDQEMKNLLVENMLKETQLKVLQSQINPHFLFNTLNAVVQTAVLEDAWETERLIDSVADILRYSLTMLESQSCIEDEVAVIKKYAYIQETRFKDRIRFNVEMDEELGKVSLPGMTLQPLVENAFIHGIEGREEGGTISLKVFKEEDQCVIKIEDDGVGMTEEKIREVLSSEARTKNDHHTSGIGLGNVIKRLRVLYNLDDVFSIESKIGEGTRMIIRIPV
ncbi:MAG: sensor histidine kinase [Bacillota bacterium]|nr:sensor histidine kinase [Bacillota bacterium]